MEKTTPIPLALSKNDFQLKSQFCRFLLSANLLSLRVTWSAKVSITPIPPGITLQPKYRGGGGGEWKLRVELLNDHPRKM